MGYYSHYTLTVLEGDESLIETFREENEEAQYAFDENGACQDSTKWYDSDDDLKAFSLKHPDALFLLESQGEEGEQSQLYVQNGKSQECPGTVIFEPFDRSKLK